MLKRNRRRLVGGATVLAVVGAAVILTGPGVAAASTPTTGLGALQAKAATDITTRLDALNRTIPKVSANQIITAADRATLLATLNADVTGLAALAKTIAADTTTAQASADTKTIFATYRVFALAIPQVAYAAAAADITVAELPALIDAQQGLAAVLEVETAKNTSAVAASMTDLGQQIAALTSSTNGLSGMVLAYTPAQYDADPGLLSAPRQTLASAQADVASAKNDITAVTGALQ
jgi:hypothetical protein